MSSQVVVLVFQADVGCAQALAKMLARQGVKAVVVSSLAECPKAAEEHQPAAIIMAAGFRGEHMRAAVPHLPGIGCRLIFFTSSPPNEDEIPEPLRPLWIGTVTNTVESKNVDDLVALARQAASGQS